MRYMHKNIDFSVRRHFKVTERLFIRHNMLWTPSEKRVWWKSNFHNPHVWLVNYPVIQSKFWSLDLVAMVVPCRKWSRVSYLHGHYYGQGPQIWWSWFWVAITFCRRQSTRVQSMSNISTMMALMVIITQYKSRSSKRVGTRRPSLINLLALKPILSLGQSSAWSLALPQSSHTLAKNIGKGNKCLVHMNDDTAITCGPELLFQL